MNSNDRVIRINSLLAKRDAPVPYDVKAAPMKFLSKMIYMNKELERMGRKTFRCFSLRTDIIPDHIDIDTYILARFAERPQRKFNGEDAIEVLKSQLWGQIFNLRNSLFKAPSRYKFHYMIRTDGISIVVLFSPLGYTHKYTQGRKRPEKIDLKRRR